MDLVTVLNVIHVVFSMFWVGGAYMNSYFIAPAAQEAGPEGQKFMATLMKGNRLSNFLTASALTAILSGLAMIWIMSGNFDLEWFQSGRGLILAIGGVVALIAFAIGQFIMRPTAAAIGALGAEIQAGGGPPSEEQMKKMQQLQGKLFTNGRWVAILLIGTTVLMAVGRWTF